MIGAVGIVVVSHNSTALAIILLALGGSLTTTALSRFLSSNLTDYIDFFANLAFRLWGSYLGGRGCRVRARQSYLFTGYRAQLQSIFRSR